jgi:hypothetical protein
VAVVVTGEVGEEGAKAPVGGVAVLGDVVTDFTTIGEYATKGSAAVHLSSERMTAKVSSQQDVIRKVELQLTHGTERDHQRQWQRESGRERSGDIGQAGL